MQLLSELDGDYIKVSRFSQHLVGFPILFRYINQSILPRSVLLQRSTNFRYQSLSRRCSQDEDPAEIPSHSVAQHVFAKKLDSKLHGTWSISRGPSKTNTISQKCIHDTGEFSHQTSASIIGRCAAALVSLLIAAPAQFPFLGLSLAKIEIESQTKRPSVWHRFPGQSLLHS